MRSTITQGYKNRSIFLKFGKNRRNWAGPNLKTAKNTVHCFKISKKDKNHQNICKKTRSNSKVTGEEFFCKTKSLGLVKFKFHQICLNSFKRVRPNLLFRPNSLFIRPVYRQNRPVFDGWGFHCYFVSNGFRPVFTEFGRFF
jgi:hypothetical protein